jgi:hypothetical protein
MTHHERVTSEASDPFHERRRNISDGYKINGMTRKFRARLPRAVDT